MGHRDSDVTLNGGVGQIPLQSGDRELHRKESQHGVGHSKVTFGVLEIYRIDLVRHSRRPNLVLGDLLVEIFHRDVGPDVPAQIDENSVDATQAVEDRCEIVVVVYLGCREGPLETKRGYEPVGERRPVDVREGDLVGVHIAGRAAEFGGPGQLAELA